MGEIHRERSQRTQGERECVGVGFYTFVFTVIFTFVFS